MPPLPRPRPTATSARSTSEQTPVADKQAPADRSSDGSDSQRRGASVGAKVAQREALRKKIELAYMGVGMMVRPMGRMVPILTPLGDQMRSLSGEAADAWMEWADDDPKVMAWIKRATTASAAGNVLGVHIAMFAGALPGAVSQQQQQQQRQAQEATPPFAMPPIPNMPARDTSTGGPGDTVRVPPPPAYAPNPVPQPAPEPTPPPQQPAGPVIIAGGVPSGVSGVPKAAIVSPTAMGVTVVGQQGGYGFPAGGPPNGRATQ